MKTEAIDRDFAKKTCKLGQLHECCRYLAADVNGFCCLKQSEFKDHLDQRVKNKDMTARGDNCKGWQHDS
jgi:hypothetical protein